MLCLPRRTWRPDRRRRGVGEVGEKGGEKKIGQRRRDDRKISFAGILFPSRRVKGKGADVVGPVQVQVPTLCGFRTLHQIPKKYQAQYNFKPNSSSHHISSVIEFLKKKIQSYPSKIISDLLSIVFVCCTVHGCCDINVYTSSCTVASRGRYSATRTAGDRLTTRYARHQAGDFDDQKS